LIERRLDHESGEAHAFYRDLQGPVRVGIEATGPIRWFERLLAELGHELPAESAQMAVTKIADHLGHGQWSFGDDVLAERV
jgi:hypothetical protein